MEHGRRDSFHFLGREAHLNEEVWLLGADCHEESNTRIHSYRLDNGEP